MATTPEEWDDLALQWAKGALENIDSQFEKTNSLPLCCHPARAIVFTVLANVVRNAIEETARLHEDMGIDIATAIRRPTPKRDEPPSPL